MSQDTQSVVKTVAQHPADPAAAGALIDSHAPEGNVVDPRAVEHGAEDQGAEVYLMPHEVPNIALWAEALIKGKDFEGHHGQRPHPSQTLQLGPIPVPINPLFSILYAVLIVMVIRKGLARASVTRPGKLQNVVEMFLGGLRKFFMEVLGPGNERYLPYVGSLFIFILVNNWMGMVPLLKAPTSSLKTTVALGLFTFCYVHWRVIRDTSFKAWFLHLVGEPRWMFPLMFPLHVLGELIKPVSLSARLFGNILGEDKLLAAFLGMGMLITAGIFHTATPVIGVPLNFWVFFLMVLGCTIQALVFALLASIYIVLLLPHDDHAHDGEHGAVGHAGGRGH